MYDRHTHGIFWKLLDNTEVRTLEAKAMDYNSYAEEKRKWGVTGTIIRYSNDGHGSYYEVEHDDGSRGCYDFNELEVLSRKQEVVDDDLPIHKNKIVKCKIKDYAGDKQFICHITIYGDITHSFSVRSMNPESYKWFEIIMTRLVEDIIKHTLDKERKETKERVMEFLKTFGIGV